MSLLNPGNGASQETELYFKTLEPYSFIERNGEIGWKKENLKRMFCKGNTATCLPSMVIGASHPVAMWKADKLSSYCQGPRGACRRYSASLAFRAPIQRSGSNFIDTRKLSKNNLPLKCGNLKCELPNTMQSSIDIFIPFPSVVSFPSIWENSIITRSPLLRGIHPVSHAAETPRAHSETILLTEDPFVM
ncbi:uncharacterized protein LOC123839428 isoform X4 [Mirounga angustirostris]|uniref:uncharacterized protein LOC123839428 isoform X4 n=1 Tax=Mirounga angustirostris TaxID=9716 RepID=UPI00313ED544